MSENRLRELPAMTAVLASDAWPELEQRFGRERCVELARALLTSVRESLLDGRSGDVPDVTTVVRLVGESLEREARPMFRPVINATGIPLHTNLGRSPISEQAAQAAEQAGRGYLNLELDLATGERSSRQTYVRELLCELTGAESATVVNNCAAATVIALRALALGREVIVSRGQLVEIGGSFRIPEIMAVSGATLREVGTTNITRLADYASAVNEQTAALMLIHQSNFRIRGFTKAASLEELVGLGRERGVPVIDDCGSGAMIDFAEYGLPGEPVIPERVRAGADLVLFSGDKLLGGPQAGVILGRKELVTRIEKDPLMRAFRLDKMTLAALEATLRQYRDGSHMRLPTLAMITMSIDELRARTERFASRLRALNGLTATIREADTYVGGGSIPEEELPTVVLHLHAEGTSETTLAARLRTGEPAVLPRVADGRVRIDLRTVFENQEDDLLGAIRTALSNAPPEE